MEVRRTLEFLLEQQANTDAELAVVNTRIVGIMMLIERGVRLQEKQSEHLERLIDSQMKLTEVDATLDDQIVDVVSTVTEIRKEVHEVAERLNVLLEVVNGLIARPARKPRSRKAAADGTPKSV